MSLPLPFRSLLLLALPAALAAQESKDTVQLEDIVVTADRFPTPAARNFASTTVITGEELRSRGIYFLDDALRAVPGAAIVPQGSYGGTTSLFLRGGQSSYVKVLVDGVPQNQSGGFFNFAQLSTDNIDRIEVVSGPTSVLYGTDAVTGVVQIFTRKGSGDLRGEVSARAGTYGTVSGDVGVQGGNDQFSYSASLGRYTTDGTYRFNSDYRNTLGSGALTVHPDDRTDLTLSARTGESDTHFPTGSDGTPVDSNQHAVLNSTTLSLDLGRHLSKRAEARLLVGSYAETVVDDNQPDSPGDTLDFLLQDQSRLLRRSADIRGVLRPVDRLRLTIGGVAEFEELRQLDVSTFAGFPSGSPPLAADRRNLGLYGQGVIDVTSRLLMNLGARLDDNENFGTHGTVRVGSVVALGSGLRARGSVGTAFKEPSLRENFINAPFEVGNPNLKPERATSWEVGLEENLARGRASLAAVWFDQRFRDLIQFDGAAAPGTPNYQNIARATSRGLELSAHARPVTQLTLGASYTYLKTRVDDAGFNTGAGAVFVNGEELVRRPKHSFRFDARGRVMNRVSLGGAVTVVGSRADVFFDPNTFASVRVKQSSYTLVDADAAFDLIRPGSGPIGLTATLKIENLFDKTYETVVGYQGRKRAVFVGARMGL